MHIWIFVYSFSMLYFIKQWRDWPICKRFFMLFFFRWQRDWPICLSHGSLTLHFTCGQWAASPIETQWDVVHRSRRRQYHSDSYVKSAWILNSESAIYYNRPFKNCSDMERTFSNRSKHTLDEMLIYQYSNIFIYLIYSIYHSPMTLNYINSTCILLQAIYCMHNENKHFYILLKTQRT